MELFTVDVFQTDLFVGKREQEKNVTIPHQYSVHGEFLRNPSIDTRGLVIKANFKQISVFRAV